MYLYVCCTYLACMCTYVYASMYLRHHRRGGGPAGRGRWVVGRPGHIRVRVGRRRDGHRRCLASTSPLPCRITAIRV